MQLLFDPEAWQQYVDWQAEDKRTLRKINSLLKAIMRDDGEGKPEPLRGELAGCWSRRINEQDRLIYRIVDEQLQVVACRGHYSDT